MSRYWKRLNGDPQLSVKEPTMRTLAKIVGPRVKQNPQLLDIRPDQGSGAPLSRDL